MGARLCLPDGVATVYRLSLSLEIKFLTGLSSGLFFMANLDVVLFYGL
jgi:hypothetical protein